MDVAFELLEYVFIWSLNLQLIISSSSFSAYILVFGRQVSPVKHIKHAVRGTHNDRRASI
jgi:hypothetical protein